MLSKTQKEKIVEELSDKLRRQKIAVFTDFHGIAVSKAHALRKILKSIGAEYKVAKKTLLDRALERAGLAIRTKEMRGEIGVAFGYKGEIESAKQLVRFGKENETFKILSAILAGGRALTVNDVFMLAKLPGRDILLTQFVGLLQSPLQNLARALAGNIQSLSMILIKIKDTKR